MRRRLLCEDEWKAELRARRPGLTQVNSIELAFPTVRLFVAQGLTATPFPRLATGPVHSALHQA